MSANKYEMLIDEIVEYVVPKDSKDKFISQKPYNNYICYFLWVLKTNNEIKTYDDMEEKGYRREGDKFPPLGLDDIVIFFIENNGSWDRLLELKDKYTVKELADALLNVSYFDNYNMGDVPLGITNLVNEILGISDNDSVLEVDCARGAYLFDTGIKNGNCTIAGFNDNYMELTETFIKEEVSGIKNIRLYEYDEFLFSDKVFINANISGDERRHCSTIDYALRDEKEDFPRDSVNWSKCMYGILSQNEGGRTVAVMNSRELTLKSFKDVRKYFCENGYIEGVIALADKIYENTWINSYIVIFGKEKKSVKFLDATDMYEAARIKGKRINVITEEMAKQIFNMYKNEGIYISLEELEQNDYSLNPIRYITSLVPGVKKVKLGDLLEELGRGMTINAAKADECITDTYSKMRCVSQSSISEGVVITDKFYHGNKVNSNNVAVYGDILLSKSCSPVKVAVSKEICMVVGNVYILRINKDLVFPEYVKCFLESEQGQEIINSLTSGSDTKYITVENIKNIEIPVYEKEKQRELNIKAEEMVSQLEEYYSMIIEKKQEINALFTRM